MNSQPPIPVAERQSFGDRSADAGYMLVAVIVMTALVLIALSVATPVIAKDLRRDKEVESEHRAEQYVRAIRLYYRKTHAYPPSVDALKNTNNIRFLRQEYVDPLTGKSDWKLIHLGEQKTTVKGFFGQELGGVASGGLGSASGMASGIGAPIGGTSSQNCISGGSALSSGFNGACQTSTSGAGGATGATGSTGSTSAFGNSGSAFGSSGSAFGSSGSTGSSGGLGGGGAIIGVTTARTGASMTQPNQQSTYETWEFWYDPRIEQLYQKGITNMGIGGGAPGSTPASSIGTTPGGLSGSSSFSNTPGASSPSTPAPSPLGSGLGTTTPQQP
jgi:type II secretory pathway pseudopilin PulG